MKKISTGAERISEFYFFSVNMNAATRCLELVFIGFMRGFSSIILPRARRKSESILPYGEFFQRSYR